MSFKNPFLIRVLVLPSGYVLFTTTNYTDSPCGLQARCTIYVTVSECHPFNICPLIFSPSLCIEVKYAQRDKLESACQKTLQQIAEKKYAAELGEEGCHTIYHYGIACFRKQCSVAVEKEAR